MLYNKLKHNKNVIDEHTYIKTPTNLGLMAVNYLRQNTINQEDNKKWNITGIKPEDKKVIDEIFWRSEMTMQKSKGISLLFDEGKFVATTFVINNKPYLNFGKVVEWSKVGDKYIYIYAQGSDVYEVNGVEQVQVLKYYYKNGKPVVEYGYSEMYTKGKGLPSADFKIRDGRSPKKYTYVFDGDTIPAEVVPNLYTYKGDIEHFGGAALLNEIERQGNWIGPEFDLLKNNVLINRQGAGNKGSDAWRNKFQKANVHTLDNLDAVILDSVNVLPADKQTILQIQLNINWMIDKLEKFMFFLRDTTSTGTNKFNSEIMMFNQVALEMLINKQALREEYYTRFMRRLLTETNAMGLTSSNVEEVQVKIDISDIEQIKLDTLKAQAENLQTSNVKVENKDGESKENKKEDKEK